MMPSSQRTVTVRWTDIHFGTVRVQRMASACEAREIEHIVARLRVALPPSFDWHRYGPVIDEWAQNNAGVLRHDTYLCKLEEILQRVLRGEYPAMDGCPRCVGLGCMACDFHGTLAGRRQQMLMEREANEALEAIEAEHREYVARGICSGCGAASPQQAATLCRPTPLADTGEYECPGEDLWENERKQ